MRRRENVFFQRNDKHDWEFKPFYGVYRRKPAKPASPAANAVDVSEYTVGRKVEHSKFGTGVIVSVSGSGNETIAGIEFENLGIKKFVVALAAKNMRLL